MIDLPRIGVDSGSAAAGASAFGWDGDGELVTMSGPGGSGSNVYDADGDLLVARDGAGKTLYVDDGTEIRYTAPTAGSAGGVVVRNHYAWLGQAIAVADSTTAAATAGVVVVYTVTDPHNTGMIAVDDGGTVSAIRRFDPFGNPRTPTTGAAAGGGAGGWPSSHGFVDGPVSPVTGLTHLGARDYDPALGRFLSVDPVLTLTDPTQHNGYGYANNNPTTLSDPDGLEPGSWCNTPSCTHHDTAMRHGKAKPCGGRCYDNTPYTWKRSRSERSSTWTLTHRNRTVYTFTHTPRATRPKPKPIDRRASVTTGERQGSWVSRHSGLVDVASKVGMGVAFGACVFMSAGACLGVGLVAGAISAADSAGCIDCAAFKKQLAVNSLFAIGGAAGGLGMSKVYEFGNAGASARLFVGSSRVRDVTRTGGAGRRVFNGLAGFSISSSKLTISRSGISFTKGVSGWKNSTVMNAPHASYYVLNGMQGGAEFSVSYMTDVTGDGND